MLSYSNRKTSVEWKAAGWAARHPGSLVVPGSLAASLYEFGPTVTGAAVGGCTLGLGAWYRGHPDSFDAWVAPRLRAWRRRWFSRYSGGRWRDTLLDCDLAPTHRKTGEPRVPRVVRVRSASPSVDTVFVRMVSGQSVKQWEAKADELAIALNAERVGIEKVKPQLLAVIVQRRESFTEIIEAPDMPWDSDMVDLRSVYMGETEYGGDWREPVIGEHRFGAGATGAGKGALIWSPLRSMAPLIRDGLVRLWMVDPKRMELVKSQPIAHRYAAEPEDCVELVREYVEDLEATERTLAAEGRRKFVISRETPLNLLVMDELGALLGFGDYALVKEMKKHLSYVGTQGRATGHSMWGFVQEPTKDTVPVRDLFTVRMCLRTTATGHADMVLGDGARLRGALADEIPNSPETAGIGYVLRQKSRLPMRVRASFVDDSEIDELVKFVQTGRSGLKVVA